MCRSTPPPWRRGVLAYPDRANRIAGLDAMIAELSLLDDNLDALGTLVADTGPFEARTYATIRQTYTAGKKDVEPGGGFIVARQFMAGFGGFQTDDETADNYISIASSKANVRFSRSALPMGGMHGGFRRATDTLVFRVTSGEADRGRHGDHHLRRYDRRFAGLAHAHFLERPHAVAALRRLRRLRLGRQPAHPADRHRWRPSRRRPWLRALGGGDRRSVHVDRACRG